jgi:hypothetical protein
MVGRARNKRRRTTRCRRSHGRVAAREAPGRQLPVLLVCCRYCAAARVGHGALHCDSSRPRRLMEAPHADIMDAGSSEVSGWLLAHGLDAYSVPLLESGYNRLVLLRGMDAAEMEEVIAEKKMPRPHARAFRNSMRELWKDIGGGSAAPGTPGTAVVEKHPAVVAVLEPVAASSLAARPTAHGPKQEDSNSIAKANAKKDPPGTAKKSENDQAAIVVRTLTGAKLEIPGLNRSSKIAEMKASVKQQHGIPVDEQRLVLSGNELKDWRTLADYRISGKSDLHLVLRAPPTGEERARLAMEQKAEEALAAPTTAPPAHYPTVDLSTELLPSTSLGRSPPNNNFGSMTSRRCKDLSGVIGLGCFCLWCGLLIGWPIRASDSHSTYMRAFCGNGYINAVHCGTGNHRTLLPTTDLTVSTTCHALSPQCMT